MHGLCVRECHVDFKLCLKRLARPTPHFLHGGQQQNSRPGTSIDELPQISEIKLLWIFLLHMIMGFSEDRVIISLNSTVYKFLARASRVAEVSNRWELLLMSPLWSGFPLTSLALSHFSWQFWILTSHSLYFCTDPLRLDVCFRTANLDIIGMTPGITGSCHTSSFLLAHWNLHALLLHAEAFAHTHTRARAHSFYTQVLLHTESFNTQSLYIQKTFIYHYWPAATFSQEMKVERQKL